MNVFVQSRLLSRQPSCWPWLGMILCVLILQGLLLNTMLHGFLCFTGDIASLSHLLLALPLLSGSSHTLNIVLNGPLIDSVIFLSGLRFLLLKIWLEGQLLLGLFILDLLRGLVLLLLSLDD